MRLPAILFSVLSFPLLSLAQSSLYVSPSGSDSAAGTLAAPFATIQKAVDAATPGTTIFLRAGTYAPSKNVQITKKGSSSARYVVRPYNAERVVLDGENLPGTPAPVGGSLANGDRGILHVEGAAFWEFYDLELKNGPYGVYVRDASDNRFERLSTHDNYESGFQIQGSSSRNLVFYLDSYRNRDPRKNGESADGFACKEGSGSGNVLRGARLWDNVDDGLDLWEFAGSVTVEDTVAWGNGYNRWGFSPFEGDGNGFKLGGSGKSPVPSGAHVVRNCLAFANLKKGFIDNGNTAALTVERNTAYRNGDTGFNFRSSSSRLSANIAALNGGSAGQASISNPSTASGNSWNIGGTWDNSTFSSVDDRAIKGARQSGGKIASTTFLLPKSGQAIGSSFR